MTRSPGIRIAIVGCGTIAYLHANGVLKTPGAEIACLVDVDERRARRLADTVGLRCAILPHYAEVPGRADAAIVALPHHLHAEVTESLLRAGLHVLCEKPLATCVVDAERCVAAAEEKKLTLSVGMIRRFHWNTALMRFLIAERYLGALDQFEYVDGSEHRWPSATPFYFRKDLAGGGIFMTMGTHLIDTLLVWFEEIEVVNYSDDSFGGVEADCVTSVRVRSGQHWVGGKIRCTNLYDLPSHFTLVGSDRSACVRAGNTISVEVREWLNDREVVLSARDPRGPEISPLDEVYFTAQIDDFVEAISSGRQPKASGQEAVKGLRIIEECYRLRTPLEQDWAPFCEGVGPDRVGR